MEYSEKFTDGFKQELRVHSKGTCLSEHCVIHNPSTHSLSSAPLYWRWDRAMFERICKHGVGHPDPDHLAWVRKSFGKEAAKTEGIHGCDGCCRWHST